MQRMSQISQLIADARALLQFSQAEKALELLTPIFESNSCNVPFLQIFGETLLENNDLENAYNILIKACELDPTGDQGTEKFLYLGQIIGGSDGLKYLDNGLNKLSVQLNAINEDKGEDDNILVELSKVYKTKEQLQKYFIKKLNQGIFAKIEIWMTDLCMEPEAEDQCNDLIAYSLELDDQNPESLSLLSSIRISQQRVDEAKEALKTSWTLFQDKKTKLEEAANNLQIDSEEKNQSDSFEVGLEYMELIQPLLTLARFAIELELYEIAITISSNSQDINENILESYYYEALANILSAKQIAYKIQSSNVEDYRDLEIKELMKSQNSDIKAFIDEAKSALTQGYKITQTDSVDADPELIDQVLSLVDEVGGPIISELMPQRLEAEEEGWEEEINSDEEL
ncbi:DEHA2E16522p [Debaryomyces hansenii CBS767]|uniref:DEHA2E16522p n=1 Tax=Debaryomyces hansenii (strain ATCC 36239 / CBS 767 / BCRC 21394 / JCM 1990 / NBRC 0083 / IGC 2968) TaxID=284592 RepID=Q6BP50_DEBHA|nr:DEHA2E16522p [Debaryomyces hansenii CBS767]CAG88273.2 DEHA2E16522p [Debaryomyces hansenii CBS767]|eukprot:XP_460020.2 DEHA2E16522p [Debaryomyces hansenii CBS767]